MRVTDNGQRADQSQSGASEQLAKAEMTERVSVANDNKTRKKRRSKPLWGKPRPPKRFDAFAVSSHILSFFHHGLFKRENQSLEVGVRNKIMLI